MEIRNITSPNYTNYNSSKKRPTDLTKIVVMILRSVDRWYLAPQARIFEILPHKLKIFNRKSTI